MFQDTLTRKYLEQLVRELGLHDEEEAIQYLAQLVNRYGKKISAVRAMNEAAERLEKVVEKLEKSNKRRERLEIEIALLCRSVSEEDIDWLKSLPEKNYMRKIISSGRIERLADLGKILEVICREAA